MKDNAGKLITLGIETGICGGSLALLRGHEVLGSASGGEAFSRAEDLIPTISSLLSRCEIDEGTIELIAVSIGPGSFTGLRIGIATAMGLHDAVRARILGVPLLQAIAHCSSFDGTIAVAVPIGRTDAAFQCFEQDDLKGRSINGPTVSAVGSIQDVHCEGELSAILAHSALISMLDRDAFRGIELKDIGSDLARFIAIAAIGGLGQEKLELIYLQNPERKGGRL